MTTGIDEYEDYLASEDDEERPRRRQRRRKLVRFVTRCPFCFDKLEYNDDMEPDDRIRYHVEYEDCDILDSSPDVKFRMTETYRLTDEAFARKR